MASPLLISSETVSSKKPQMFRPFEVCLNDSTCKPNHFYYDVLKKILPKNNLYKDNN